MPQGDLTICMGYYETDNILTLANLMEQAINDKTIDASKVILHHEENVDLIPSNLDLSAISFALISAISRERIMQNCIKDIKEKYDYVLIDCSPSLDMITLNALSCADKVIIPVQTQYLAAKAMTQFELDDLKLLHEFESHIEHSEIYEETLYNKSFQKQESLENKVMTNILVHDLIEVMEFLPYCQRKRIVLYFFQNLSLEQIAQIEETSHQAISKSIKNGISKMRRMLEFDNYIR